MMKLDVRLTLIILNEVRMSEVRGGQREDHDMVLAVSGIHNHYNFT